MKGRPPDPVRTLAWTVLRDVAERDAYANLVLPRLLRESGLDPRDRALATELTYGALRAQGALDHVLAMASSRPLDAVDPPVLDALRLGAYQLLRTRIPPHAAVAVTVDLVRATSGEGASRFANAVLRRVGERARRDDPYGLAQIADPVERTAVETAHPRWIVEAYADALGGLEAARPALLADDERPITHLVARSVDRDDLVAAIPGATAGPWSPRAVHLSEGGDPADVAAVRDGRAAVQDEGSQLVALALANAEAPAGPVVDLCAGPGGKSGLLAAVLADAPLLAVERQPHRARLVATS
ncbi:MAG TPA: transcription antitermination factor NusB, partial [Mycobacteriales bacterium]|nr:transcription antitermination factor NusB [Mycobacteriales bacterium]